LKSTSVPLPRGSEPKSTGKSLQYILDHNLPQISGRLHFQTHQYIQVVDRMSRFISPLWCFFLQRRHDPLYPYDLPITPISYGESPRSSSRFPWRCLDPNRWWTSQKAGDYSPKDMATKKNIHQTNNQRIQKNLAASTVFWTFCTMGTCTCLWTMGAFAGVKVIIWKWFSMDWFKGKSTGNHGFYHQI
jgi:hypothetical protein